jgi:hypothetical protein
MQGQVIKSIKLSDPTTRISTNGIDAGIYFIRFMNELGNEKTMKIYLQ